MNFISYDDFKNTDDYQNFIKENPDIGYLKVMAFTAYQAVPVEGVEILITKDIGNNRVLFFKGYTNSSGIIDNIQLPAPKSGYDAKDFKISNYTIYDLTAIKQDFDTIQKYYVGMFGDIQVIQYVKMITDVPMKGDNNGN